MKIKETLSKAKKAIKKVTTKSIDLPYKERLEKFSKEYKDLTVKYGIDFTIMTIDLKQVYQEGGVNKLRETEETN